jgi:hypothetical protein
MRLKRIGAHAYHGRRGGLDLGVMSGAEIELPDEVAASLLKDFPRDWLQVGGRDEEDRVSVSPREAPVTGADGKSPPPTSPMAHEQAPASADPPRRGRGRPPRVRE